VPGFRHTSVLPATSEKPLGNDVVTEAPEMLALVSLA
jgi:hypothetical protein